MLGCDAVQLSRCKHQVRATVLTFTPAVKKQGSGRDRGRGGNYFGNREENFDLVNVSPETTATETSPGLHEAAFLFSFTSDAYNPGSLAGVQRLREAVSLCSVVSQPESNREVRGTSGELVDRVTALVPN